MIPMYTYHVSFPFPLPRVNFVFFELFFSSRYLPLKKNLYYVPNIERKFIWDPKQNKKNLLIL